MAARDRLGALGGPAQSTLQRYIQSACDPANFEPNLALNLEIADLINSKKGNAPREAAVAIVNYINHRNSNVALLALALLDICVKNCGFPFHLQIGTKEFLNELVRRFPERPPMRPSRVQLRILEAIEEWRQTICKTSRNKEDLGYIRDMHRLLSFKGYMFPEIKSEDAAVLNPSDNLKSAEEMEEEERVAQSAKLQELIRRGGPQDLQEANRLMKVMAGYDTKHRTDYRAKAAEEVSKIQQKARILEEMLQGLKKGDKLSEGDVSQELATALQNAQPKIQRMCEEESEDTEAVAKLLEINDSIHRTLERYKLVKKGDFDGASKIPQGTLGTSSGVSKSADNELSLIDLGGDAESSSNGVSQQPSTADGGTANSLENDLLGLSFNDSSYGQGGGIALSIDNTSQRAHPSIPTLQPQQQPGQRQLQQQSSPPTSDPFAPANRAPSRQSSPFDFQQQPFPLPAALGATPSGGPSPPQIAQAGLASSSSSSINNNNNNNNNNSQLSSGANDNDDWTFASALPDAASLPATSEVTVTNTAVNVVFSISRPWSEMPCVRIITQFTNNTAQPISEITFQVAVTKSFSLKLNPQSGRDLLPHQRCGITQLMHVNGVPRGQGAAVRVRWRLSYRLGIGPAAEVRHEQGEVSSLGIL